MLNSLIKKTGSLFQLFLITLHVSLATTLLGTRTLQEILFFINLF